MDAKLDLDLANAHSAEEVRYSLLKYALSSCSRGTLFTAQVCSFFLLDGLLLWHKLTFTDLLFMQPVFSGSSHSRSSTCNCC